MVRVWDNAAAIAFYRGEQREHRDLISKFANIFENTTRLIGWNPNLAFFTTRYNYSPLILPPWWWRCCILPGKSKWTLCCRQAGPLPEYWQQLP